ncbi:hypothetical protein HDU96_006825 [Phlyctochytrium bullatum]|nr:hypothetical protein HDU96_006825 [Phlyctochytrium bullatum]
MDCIALSEAFPTLLIPTTVDCCTSFPGITCDPLDRVTVLSFSSLPINGPVGASIRNLTSLSYVTLHGCNVMGGLDAFEGMTWLKSLTLTANALSGPLPTWLGDITSMAIFHLSGNGLSGQLPAELSRWKNLRFLGLGDNRFIGRVPPSWNKDNWPELGTLLLNNMPLIGTVDDRFGNATIDLTKTCITASPSIPNIRISRHPTCQPSHFRDCNSLTTAFPTLGIPRLDCCTAYDGVLCTPDGRVSELHFSGKPINAALASNALLALSALTVLEMDGAGLVGPFDALKLQDATGLRRVSLVGNKLTGTVHPDVGDFFPNMEHFDVSHNNVGGVIPESMSKWSKLRFLGLGDNAFESSLPSNFTRQNWPVLEKLSITNMPVTGILDASFINVQIDVQGTCIDVPSSLSQVLRSRHPTCPLPTTPAPLPDCLALASAFPTLPITPDCCSYPGITCSDEGRIRGIQFPGEPIRGAIGTSLGSLTELELLDVSNAGVTGGFEGLRGLSKLRIVLMYENELSGELPAWLGDELLSMQVFHIKWNTLSGPLPPSLAKWRDVAVIFLGDNRFEGPVPVEYNRFNFPFLRQLTLNNQPLTGSLDASFVSEEVLVDIRQTCIDPPAGFNPDYTSRRPECSLPGDNPTPPASPDCLTLTTTFPTLNIPASTCCTFPGVTCSPDNRITALHFSRQPINGPIGGRLPELTELVEVELTGCGVVGTLDTFRGLKRLRKLGVRENMLRGELSVWLGNEFPEMEWFDVARNVFGFELPESLGKWKSLKFIDSITNMPLTGMLDSKFGNVFIDVRESCIDTPSTLTNVLTSRDPSCPLTAPQPTPDCTALSDGFPTLGLSKVTCCSFPGITCNDAGRITKIYFSEKTIDAPLGVSLGWLTELEEFDVNQSGVVGGFEVLRGLKKLKLLSLWANDLKGGLPFWVGDAFPELERVLNADKSLGANQFTGSIPDSYNRANWPFIKFMGISENTLTGTLNPSFGNVRIDARETCVIVPAVLTNVQFTRNPNCPITPPDPSPPPVAPLSDCIALSDAFPTLKISKTNCCAFNGVGCSKAGRVTSIAFGGRQINAAVGASLAQLTEMAYVDLNNCGLKGGLEPFRTMSKLWLLTLFGNSLSGELPSWLADAFPDMINMNFQWNLFSGRLQASLSNMKKLTDLNLGNNNLTGDVPSTYTRENWPRLENLFLNNMLITGPVDPALLSINTDLTNTCVTIPPGVPMCPLISPRPPSPSPSSTPSPSPGTDADCTALQNAFPTLGIPATGCCLNQGVICEAGRIVSINFSGRSINGRLGASIGQLSELREIDVNSANVVGGLEPLRKLRKLRLLSLWQNPMNAELPSWLGDAFPDMEVFHIQWCQFTGRLPDSMSKWRKIRELFLGNNRLLGTIPQSFNRANWPALEFIGISDMPLIGTLDSNFRNLRIDASRSCITAPTSLSNSVYSTHASCSGLLVPYADCRALSEAVPAFNVSRTDCCYLNGVTCNQVGRITKIEFSNQQVNGPIGLSLTQLTEISSVNLTNCNLTGGIEVFISTNKLIYLTLLGNNLSGELPDWLGDAFPDIAELNLESNKFEGRLPASLGKLRMLAKLRLGMNSFTGDVPLSFARVNWPVMKELSLHDNLVTGTIDKNFGSMSIDVTNTCVTVPPELTRTQFSRNPACETTSPTPTPSLTPSNDCGALAAAFPTQNFPSTPDCCQAAGITCNAAGRITTIRFERVNISSSIGVRLAELTELDYVDINSCQITGGLGAFRGLNKLKVLSLWSNQMSSTLPDWIADMTELQILYLQDNRFEGGIPESFGRLSKLEELLWLNGMPITGTLDEALVQTADVNIINSCITIPASLDRVDLGRHPDCSAALTSTTSQPTSTTFTSSRASTTASRTQETSLAQILPSPVPNVFPSPFDPSLDGPMLRLVNPTDIIPQLPATLGANPTSQLSTRSTGRVIASTSRTAAQLPVATTIYITAAGSASDGSSGGNDGNFLLTTVLAVGVGVLMVASITLAGLLAWRLRSENNSGKNPSMEPDHERAELPNPGGPPVIGAFATAAVQPRRHSEDPETVSNEDSSSGYAEYYPQGLHLEVPQETPITGVVTSITDKPTLASTSAELDLAYVGAGVIGRGSSALPSEPNHSLPASSASNAGSGGVSIAGKREPSIQEPASAAPSSTPTPVVSGTPDTGYANFIARWTPSQVRDRLVSMGIGPMLAALLEGNGVTGYQLLTMTDDGLGALGVSDENARALMLFAVRRMKEMYQRGRGDVGRPLLS